MPAFVAPRCGRLVYSRIPFQGAALRFATRTRTGATAHKQRKPKAVEAGGEFEVTLNDGGILENDEKKSKKTRPHVWASRLERNTLGESSSVLILRDVEHKKVGFKLPRSEGEGADNSMNPNQIIRSLKGQSLDPEQQEVNESIDSMRPANSFPHYGRAPCIPLTTFESLIKCLSEGFNETQLARYITASWGLGKDTVISYEDPSQSRNQSKLLWHSLGSAKSKQAKQSQSSPLRGKKVLAHRIIRSTWGFEVQEEIESIGWLNLQVDPKHLELILVGGDTSALRKISNEKNVKINVAQSKGSITLTADKYKCLEVAEVIERLLHDVHTVEYDLKPFRTPRRKANTSALFEQFSSIANRFHCALEEDLTTNKLIIRSRNRSSSEHCQRILTLALLDLPHDLFRSHTVTAKNIEMGNICTASDSVLSIPNVRRPSKLGRFSIPYALSNQREPPTKWQVARSVIDAQLSRDISSRLLQASNSQAQGISTANGDAASSSPAISQPLFSTQWNYSAQTELFVETGHILHAMESDTVVGTTSTSHLLEQNSSNHSFAPIASGLPHFLSNRFSDTDVKRKDFLRVRFIPSPWLYGGLPNKKPNPIVEMTLTVDYRSRNVQVEALTTIVDNQTVNVMLPEREMDIRFVKRDIIYSIDPNQIPAVKDFIREIQDSTVGYGNIRTPLFLRLRVPRNLQSGEVRQQVASPSDSDGGEVEMEFMTTGIEYEESLLYDFKGQELAVRRVGGGQYNAKYESLLMRHIVGKPSSDVTTADNEHPKDATSLTPDDVIGFVGHTSSLLRELGLAFGNMHITATKPKSSDVQKIAQRSATTSTTYSTKHDLLN